MTEGTSFLLEKPKRRIFTLRLHCSSRVTDESWCYSKGKPDRQLQLSGIAHTLPQESVEIEQARRTERIDVVLVVEGIEHLDDRGQRVPLTKLEGTLYPPIEREVLIVFAQRVAVCGGAHIWCDRLRASCLDPEGTLEAPAHLHERIEVELVPNVTIRESIVQAEVEKCQRAISEGIALVRIIILIFRKHIVPFELISLAHAFAHAYSENV